jgi:hypothetical protein
MCMCQWKLIFFVFVYLLCTWERRKYFGKQFFSFYSIKANTFFAYWYTHIKSSRTIKPDKLHSQIMIDRNIRINETIII